MIAADLKVRIPTKCFLFMRNPERVLYDGSIPTGLRCTRLKFWIIRENKGSQEDEDNNENNEYLITEKTVKDHLRDLRGKQIRRGIGGKHIKGGFKIVGKFWCDRFSTTLQ